MYIELSSAPTHTFEYTVTLTITAIRYDGTYAGASRVDTFTLNVYDCQAEQVSIPTPLDIDIFRGYSDYTSISTNDFAVDTRCSQYLLSFEVKQSDGTWLLMYGETSPSWFASDIVHVETQAESSYSVSF